MTPQLWGLLGSFAALVVTVVLGGVWAWRNGRLQERAVTERKNNEVLTAQNNVVVPLSSADADDRLSKL